MKTILVIAFLAFASVANAQSSTNKYYELRIYYATPGKLDALIQRFNDHTTRIFEKHGMENVAYWVPVANEKNALYYILAFPDKESRKKSWDAFGADAEWKEVSAKSGKIIDSIKSVFMTPSDIMASVKGGVAASERTFELRTYYCFPGKLPNLTTRFKDHTLKLFEKHGIENIAYFVTEEADGKQSKLVYMIAHKSVEEATKSWAAFRADPDWIKAKDASEKDGKIVEKVETIYLKPLVFSKIK